MMTLAELSTAIFVLLVTPGPTNTLLLLAGTERGFARALRLVPAELAGYFTTVLPLTLIGAQLLQDVPQARMGLALVAGVWVAWLAWRLWSQRDAVMTNGVHVTARTVFVTTLLNPKALIFGLVLLPTPNGVGLHLSLFAVQVVAVACLWAAGGAVLSARTATQDKTMPRIRRAASVWLALVSLTLLAKGFGA